MVETMLCNHVFLQLVYTAWWRSALSQRRDASSSKLKIKTRHDEDGDTSPQSVLHATGFIT